MKIALATTLALAAAKEKKVFRDFNINDVYKNIN